MVLNARVFAVAVALAVALRVARAPARRMVGVGEGILGFVVWVVGGGVVRWWCGWFGGEVGVRLVWWSGPTVRCEAQV